MVGWFAGDVDLRYLLVDIVRAGGLLVGDWKLETGRGRKDSHLGDRSDFHGCADDNDQVDYGSVVLCESIEEAAGKLFAKERNVGLDRSASECSQRRV